MKTYVIKNKEGKYFAGFDYLAGIDIFSENIINGLYTHTSALKHCREEIKDFDLKDCKPVKITIAEGDLEHQLAEKEQQIRHQVCQEIREKLARGLEKEIRQDTKYDRVIEIFVKL